MPMISTYSKCKCFDSILSTAFFFFFFFLFFRAEIINQLHFNFFFRSMSRFGNKNVPSVYNHRRLKHWWLPTLKFFESNCINEEHLFRYINSDKLTDKSSVKLAVKLANEANFIDEYQQFSGDIGVPGACATIVVPIIMKFLESFKKPVLSSTVATKMRSIRSKHKLINLKLFFYLNI